MGIDVKTAAVAGAIGAAGGYLLSLTSAPRAVGLPQPRRGNGTRIWYGLFGAAAGVGVAALLEHQKTREQAPALPQAAPQQVAPAPPAPATVPAPAAEAAPPPASAPQAPVAEQRATENIFPFRPRASGA